MIFIEILNYSLACAAGGLVSYYFLISLVALRYNKDIAHEVVKTRKFAIVLFTHGKEQVLSRLLYSVSGLVYPKNKYDLIVVAENYSDSIVQVAEKMGAKILVPSIYQRDENKNNILPWAIDSVLEGEESYDAVVIFDSDGLVSGNYLEVMNYYLEQGSEVVQGSFNNLRSTDESWIDKIREVDFVIDELVFPMGRKVLDLGVNLRSNGICFSTALLREFSWKSENHTNINEYGLYLRLNGIEIDFASSAVVYTKVLPTDKAKRRSANNYQLIQKYTSRLLSTTVRTKSFKYVDIMLELIIPRYANLMLFVVAMGLISGIVWSMGWVSFSALLFWFINLSVAIVGVFVALTVAGTQQKFLRSILYIPINIYIKVKGLLKKNQKREETILVTDDEKNKSLAVSNDKHS